MAQLKPGSRLRSTVCSTEVMVVAVPKDSVEITCGGAPMLELDAEPPAGGTIAADAKDGSKIGKRYIDDAASVELLCTKPGEGSLGMNGVPLKVKEAKPLPSSD